MLELCDGSFLDVTENDGKDYVDHKEVRYFDMVEEIGWWCISHDTKSFCELFHRGSSYFTVDCCVVVHVQQLHSTIVMFPIIVDV